VDARAFFQSARARCPWLGLSLVGHDGLLNRTAVPVTRARAGGLWRFEDPLPCVPAFAAWRWSLAPLAPRQTAAACPWHHTPRTPPSHVKQASAAPPLISRADLNRADSIPAQSPSRLRRCGSATPAAPTPPSPNPAARAQLTARQRQALSQYRTETRRAQRAPRLARIDHCPLLKRHSPLEPR